MTAYTSLLGLALPVTGELQGAWGDTVNNSITSLLDTAVAGTTTLSTDGDVTLTTTTGATNQSRQAILLCSGARTALRTITAPAQSKIYTIINATTGGYAVKIVGVGPTTGLTVPNGASAVVAWNGSDFIEIGSSTIGNLTVNGTLTVTGVTTLTQELDIVASNSSNIQFKSTTTTQSEGTDTGYLSFYQSDSSGSGAGVGTTAKIAAVSSRWYNSGSYQSYVGTAARLGFFVNTGQANTSLTEAISIINGGYVGINNTAPTEALHVVGNGIVSGNMTVNGSTGYNVQISGGNAYRMYATTNDLVFRSVTAGSDVMTLAYAGNVGIGVASPSTKLQVGVPDVTAGKASIRLGDSTGSLRYLEIIGASYSYDPTFVTDAARPIIFKNLGTATASMTLDSSGNLTLSSGYIGLLYSLGYNSSSNKRLYMGATNDTSVNNGASYQWNWLVAGDAGGQYLALNRSVRAGSADTETARFTSGGALYIAKTSGSSYLDVYSAFASKTTGSFNSGSYGEIPIDSVASATMWLIQGVSNANGNANYSAIVLCNTRSASYGGGNSPVVVSSAQNSTGTSAEISSVSYSISGSGTNLSLRITASTIGGSSMTFYARQICT